VFACTADLAEAFDDDPSMPTWDVRVDELLAEPGERLHYQYDYGDNWWLTLEVEDIDDGHVPPGRATLLEGAGAGPPEDCGGIHGYRMIVAASDPTHPDHRQALAEVARVVGREVAPTSSASCRSMRPRSTCAAAGAGPGRPSARPAPCR
jgi:hypothetical protein